MSEKTISRYWTFKVSLEDTDSIDLWKVIQLLYVERVRDLGLPFASELIEESV